ncbi:hypothetical protein J6590_063619 [Homalodisca vitripennis]|nr:hypothetical protein J6590_063619 [Homalodisca vitripennis]
MMNIKINSNSVAVQGGDCGRGDRSWRSPCKWIVTGVPWPARTVVCRLAAVGAGSQTMNPTNGLFQASPDPLELSLVGLLLLVLAHKR